MRWSVFLKLFAIMIVCFSIAPQSASAQTYGGYGEGFRSSREATYNSYNQVNGWTDSQPYYGYNSGYVGNRYGGGYGGYYDAQQLAIVSSNGYGSTFVFSMSRPAYGNRYRLLDHRQCRNRHCHCRR